MLTEPAPKPEPSGCPTLTVLHHVCLAFSCFCIAPSVLKETVYPTWTSLTRFTLQRVKNTSTCVRSLLSGVKQHDSFRHYQPFSSKQCPFVSFDSRLASGVLTLCCPCSGATQEASSATVDTVHSFWLPLVFVNVMTCIQMPLRLRLRV